MEGKDYYLSDGGIFLPCQYDYLLHKTYKSLPVYYALSRHLYDQNIHINTQNLERIWKALREQADSYILCLGKVKIFGLIFAKIRIYDNYYSALNKTEPIKVRLLNKHSKAQSDSDKHKDGNIKQRLYILKTKHIKYDTRHYHKVLFNEEFIKCKKSIKDLFKNLKVRFSLKKKK